MKYGQTFREAYRQVRLRKEDHEASMAIGQLKTIQDNLNQLMSILQSKGSDYELEAWVQSKITSANDKMTSAADYMKNSPSVSEAVDDKVDVPKSHSKSDDGKALAGDHGTIEDKLRMQIAQLKQQLENEKNKVVKPEPNPDTGEVPLRTGVAHAILDKKGPKPDVEKQNKTDVKLSKKKSKIEINPDVEMGVFSGGKKTNQGSELY